MNTNTFGDTTIEIHCAGEASLTAADTQAICAALVASYEDTDSLGWQAGTDAMTAAGKTRATALAVQAATRDHLTAAARAWSQPSPWSPRHPSSASTRNLMRNSRSPAPTSSQQQWPYQRLRPSRPRSWPTTYPEPGPSTVSSPDGRTVRAHEDHPSSRASGAS